MPPVPGPPLDAPCPRTAPGCPRHPWTPLTLVPLADEGELHEGAGPPSPTPWSSHSHPSLPLSVLQDPGSPLNPEATPGHHSLLFLLQTKASCTRVRISDSVQNCSLQRPSDERIETQSKYLSGLCGTFSHLE